jgi:hypothetical protein
MFSQLTAGKLLMFPQLAAG